MEQIRGSKKEETERKKRRRRVKKIYDAGSPEIKALPILTSTTYDLPLSSEVPLADTVLSNGMCAHFPNKGSHG